MNMDKRVLIREGGPPLCAPSRDAGVIPPAKFFMISSQLHIIKVAKKQILC